MEDEEIEYTLMNKREVMAYQIPPASSSAGHKADDWKQCIWRGRCQICGKGKNLAIKLIDGSSGQLFAQCSIPNGDHDKYVERVTDSSRYFVLKIQNGARHAFIGLGWEDRNDAFDFNCALADFKTTWVDRDSVPEELTEHTPSKDLSLKEGQKIKINIGGMANRESKRAEAAASGGGGFGPLAPPPSSGASGVGGFGILAPPPSSGGTSRRQAGAPPAAGGYGTTGPDPLAAPARVAAASAAAPADDFFGDFDDFQSAGPAQSSPAPAPVIAPMRPVAAAPPAQQSRQTDDFSAQFGQLNLGGPSSQTQPQQPQSTPFAPVGFQPAQPTQQQPASAAFGGFDMFGGGAPPAQKSAPPKQGRDPFDEFDIFK